MLSSPPMRLSLDMVDALPEDEPDAEHEDAYIEEMYGAPNAEEADATLAEEGEAVEEGEAARKVRREFFRFRGSNYPLFDLPQESLRPERKKLWFKHGDVPARVRRRTMGKPRTVPQNLQSGQRPEGGSGVFDKWCKW